MNVRQLFDLTGRVVIVTGGSVGLGRQMAKLWRKVALISYYARARKSAASKPHPSCSNWV